MYVTLVIYQESLNDTWSTKYKILVIVLFFLIYEFTT